MTPEIPTQNRFDPLSDLDSDDEGVFRSQTKKDGIPPIIIDGQFVNYKQVVNELKTKLKEPFTSKITRSGKTILRVKNQADHKEAMTFLDSKYQFHSYSLSKDLQPNWVLRGLPKSVTTEDIIEELTELGLKIVKVRCISKEDSEYPLHSVTFDCKTEVRKILQIKSLCYCIVSWNKYKNNSEVTQCFRCLQFGHIGKNCRRFQKCLKCGGQHNVKECQMKEANCVNCGNRHMANEKTCEHYRKSAELRQRKNKPLVPPIRRIGSNVQPPTNSVDLSSSKTFPSLKPITPTQKAWFETQCSSSSVSTQRQPPSYTQANTINDTDLGSGTGFFQEIKDLLKMFNLPKIMLFCKVLSSKLKETTDTFSKILIVVESLFQFFD